MNMETQCCNERCRKALLVGQVVYEVGPFRYCADCVKVNVVRAEPLIPSPRKGGWLGAKAAGSRP